MTRVLWLKLLRDLRLPLIVVALLLLAFECLWTKITQRITQELLPELIASMSLSDLMRILFHGPGQILQALIGGEVIDLRSPLHVLTIGYVHPLAQTILCIWAIGRAAGAISGEIDRGTMELLLAQPITRTQVILAHLAVDLAVIPFLCLALWAGTWVGVTWFGELTPGAGVEPVPAGLGSLLSAGPAKPPPMRIDPLVLWPALWNAAALLFAVSGVTLWLSARGRYRGRVMGLAVLIMLLQFLVNLIGQLWPALEPLRPFTLFFYYQPQQIILQHDWTVNLAPAWGLERTLRVNVIAVLGAVGVVGYGLALWTFRRRDVPAPL